MQLSALLSLLPLLALNASAAPACGRKIDIGSNHMAAPPAQGGHRYGGWRNGPQGSEGGSGGAASVMPNPTDTYKVQPMPMPTPVDEVKPSPVPAPDPVVSAPVEDGKAEELLAPPPAPPITSPTEIVEVQPVPAPVDSGKQDDTPRPTDGPEPAPVEGDQELIAPAPTSDVLSIQTVPNPPAPAPTEPAPSVSIAPAPEPTPAPEPNPVARSGSAIGLAMNGESKANIGSFGGAVGWYYSWGLDPLPNTEGLEFVPMLHGAGIGRDFGGKLPAGTTHVLSFNEREFDLAHSNYYDHILMI